MENTTANVEQPKVKSSFWQYPWSYREGFSISIALLIIGIGLESLTGGGFKLKMVYPLNIIILLIMINVIALLHIYGKNSRIIRWLSSIPAAISAISLVVFLVLMMGFTPQNGEKPNHFLSLLGITHMTGSVQFILAQLYLFLTLGLVTMRRATPFRGKNIAFFLNHAGLWLTLAAAGLGAGDMLRLQMVLEKGQDYNTVAYASDNKAYQLNIALKLLDFKMEEYNPKFGIIEVKSGELIGKKGRNLVEIAKGASASISDWNIQIKEYFPDAVIKDSVTYIAKVQNGSAPAAYVEAKNIKTGQLLKGWISPGSFFYPWKALKLDDKNALAMSEAEPKKFKSIIEYKTREGKHDTATIEVNKPFKLNGWKIYQSSYESDYGKWSITSTVEVIQDRWLPVVYFGFFMVMAGAVYIFWMGRKR